MKSKPVASSQSAGVLPIRMRYGVFKEPFEVRASSDIVVGAGTKQHRLRAGIWRFTAAKVRPATQCFHVFPKTFQPDQEREMRAYMERWKAKGYTPEVRTFGGIFKSAAGKRLDNRIHWVSLARFKTQAQAEALVTKLKAEQVFAWVRPETTAPGSAVINGSDANGKAGFQAEAPLEMHSDGPIELADVRTGFMKDRHDDRMLAAPLRLRIGPDGGMEVMGDLPLETYLKGVLPAEMPALWPMEALKAQAVAARSEILAGLAGKFDLEGFDYTATEDCRAYAGLGGHTVTTNRAVEETAGAVLVHDGKVATTVFCACCGGWTEDNEKVWSGPANPILRGVPDFPPGKNPAQSGLSAYGLQKWLMSKPPAWCCNHRDFRWTRKLTKIQFSEIMSKKNNIGPVQGIRPGTRGASGRLVSLEVVGTHGVARFDRELAIRQAIGGLPSAMFIIASESGKTGLASISLLGGGSGHGVGMCQAGARAMAEQGWVHTQILKHYFTGVELERLAS